jgi:hypothetical protein
MLTVRGRRGPSFVRRSLLVALSLMVLALLLPALALAQTAAPPSDLGDAPDRTNHTGTVYPAYGVVAGRFPTVFDPATGAVQGPLHQNPVPNGWLGAGISGERDADLMPDADGFTNLIPATITSNQDKFDDGVPPPNGGIINLPQCARTQFRYIVTGAPVVPVPQARVNVWFDWNRDGDWEDIFTCTTPTGAVIVVPEWSVQNQPVNIVPGSVVWATPLFPSFHAATSDLIWMRINIAEINAPLNPMTGRADGRGPANGYKYGETEDYLARFTGAPGQYQVVINP